MTEKRTRFGDTKVLADGTLEVRLEKQLVEDGAVIWKHPHRVVIHPGEDADAILAGVAAHLAHGVAITPGGPLVKYPMDAEVSPRVKATVDTEHTQERVAKFQKDKAEREARQR